MISWLTGLGRWFIEQVELLGRAGLFMSWALFCTFTPPFKFRRMLRQIWFIGWKSMLVICLTGLFTGMVLALQGFPTLRRVGSEAFLGPLVALSLIRELGPVLAALMVTGRAGSAIAAEIGMMRSNDQIDALKLMGLSPFRYLVVPNLIASVIALPLLAGIFSVIGIFGGYLVGVQLLGLNSGIYFAEMQQYVVMEDVLGGTYKAMSFGVLIAWVCCYKGYYSRFGAEGVSGATTQAVVNTAVLILVWDYFITLLVF
jgi:phospholipid/cholesterol/gamma-HCH transport system permease protein